MASKTNPAESCDLRRSSRDPEAFARFYEQHASGIVAFIARRTFDVEVARDLAAETFAQAFRSRKRFRGTTDTEAAAWLYAIARHLLSRYVRSGIVEREATKRLGITVPELGEGDYERVVELAGLADMRAIVAKAFKSLGHDQREAVRLRVVDDLPYPEVAAQLAISEPAARARVSRGLRELASAFDVLPQMKEMTA